MKKLNALIEKAKSSPFYLWILNQVLWRAIPFNSPHNFTITQITDDSVTVKMPYIRKNMNHIRGLHACGLATLCEYACGLQLMNVMGASTYRIIMKDLHMDYRYQGKTDVAVTFSLSKDWVEKEIIEALKTEDAVLKRFELQVMDKNQVHICTAQVNWQIKPWDKVKVRVG